VSFEFAQKTIIHLFRFCLFRAAKLQTKSSRYPPLPHILAHQTICRRRKTKKARPLSEKSHRL
jgi:hypothetical protein